MIVRYFFTEKPMVFRRVDYWGKVHLTDGIGYVLWEQQFRKEPKMIANTVRMRNQREANSWAKTQAEIYDCELPERLRRKRTESHLDLEMEAKGEDF